MIYLVSKSLAFFFLKLLFRLEISGRDSFPKDSAFILASNHTSYLDPLVVGSACPRKLFYLAKEELFRDRLLAFYLKNLNVIPLHRAAADIKVMRLALKILKEKPLVIFPQGTRSDSYENFKAGVGFLQKKTGLPVVAAKVRGTEKILPKGAKFPKIGKIGVIFERVSNLRESDSREEIAAKVVAKIKSL